MGTTLVINPGSSSKKYALYDEGVLVLEWRYESTVADFEMCLKTEDGKQACHAVSHEEFTGAFADVATAVNEYLAHKQSKAPLTAIAVRVVAPGTYFQSHRLIDEAFVTTLKQASAIAPLHVPHIVQEIMHALTHFEAVPLVAVSDSAFHGMLPPRAREYSLAQVDRDSGDIHRFGYHGLSVASIVRRIPAIVGRLPERLAVCHIGNGVSITAVRAGQSVETTMGYSPVSGVPMGSRAGDLDAGALLALMRKKHLKIDEAELYLNTMCGLQGLADESDIRTLLDRHSQHDKTATDALDTFSYHIQKAIAGAAVALNGIDVLVFTATAGVRSAALRAMICERLQHLGVLLHDERNQLLVSRDGVISSSRSQVQLVVMRTDEMGEMATVAAELVS